MSLLEDMQIFQAKPTDYNVTVLICTYNSAKRITETLEHLKSQCHTENIKWEVLVVDYLSSDGTPDIISQVWQGIQVPLTIISESRPGKTPALETGLANARGEAICIIDDDNWADENYISVANQIITSYPDVGVVGAYGKAYCEVDPPSWFLTYQGMYAVGPQALKSGYVGNSRPCAFRGAGSVIRKSAWLKAKEKGFIPLLNPIGGGETRFLQKSTGGEDPELCFAIQILGYRLWYEENLVYTHYISEKRLTADFIENTSFSVYSAAPFLYLYLCYLYPKSFSGNLKRLIYRTWSFHLIYIFIRHVKYVIASILTKKLDTLEVKRLNKSVLGQTITMIRIFSSFESYKQKIEFFAEKSKE